jgi:hypothetical protein
MSSNSNSFTCRSSSLLSAGAGVSSRLPRGSATADCAVLTSAACTTSTACAGPPHERSSGIGPRWRRDSGDAERTLDLQRRGSRCVGNGAFVHVGSDRSFRSTPAPARLRRSPLSPAYALKRRRALQRLPPPADLPKGRSDRRQLRPFCPRGRTRMSPACCPHRAVAGLVFPDRSCCSVEHRAHPTSRPLMAQSCPAPTGYPATSGGRSRSAMRDPSVQTRLTTIDGDSRPASRPGEHPRPVVRKGGGEHIEVVDVCCQDRLRQADGNAHQMGIHDVDGAGA